MEKNSAAIHPIAIPHTFSKFGRHMLDKHLSRLEKVGLSRAEAQVYLTLIHSSEPMGASTIVSATRVPRSSVYPILTRLTDIGLVKAEAGYGGRFSAVAAEKALPSLILHEREELLQREQLATELAGELKSVAEPSGFNGASELVQVLRDPRAVRERVERLQLEAERQIDVFTKPPYFGRGNPSEQKSLHRGVRVRSLYERSALDDPRVKPHLSEWVAAGEEARIADGELPHKLAIFDSEVVVMPLPLPGDQMRTLLIRHAQLAKSLGVTFQFYWDLAEPIATAQPKRTFRGRRIHVDGGKRTKRKTKEKK
jgi:sugar-specific transcriptional regulator TrmB